MTFTGDPAPSTPPPAPPPAPRGGDARRQVPSFLVIGGLSTLFYFALYVGLRQVASPQVSNLVALAVSAVANTAANRRFTFGVTGSEGALRHQAQGAVAFLIGLGLSVGALELVEPAASRPVEVGGLVLANVLATVVRFLLLKVWVFKGR
ncbi:GtrA family protein [Kitasatospora sp. NPDC089913]|uniref:GtrA family protein n=1 Tax=Streptomycetaceae TaxID=2062 RepID=UPI00087CB554|nr:GtrA family protein [Streptomyces sp. TLI_053]SDT74307.1 Putative flippase GtrA (transmembrane translocase of bactoprenol-linked glucose) [Streptomyces sp. TLI_053]